MTLVACVIAFVGIAIGAFFVSYGTYAGVLKKRILARHPDVYDTGRAAMTRGVFYVILGIAFLCGSAITFAVIHARLR